MMNHMKKKEVKFPIAAVFSTLNVLIGLINIFVTYTTYTRIIGIPMSEVHRAVAGSILSLVPGILLTVVLFMRKRGILLWIALGIDLVLDLLSLVSNFSFILQLSEWLLISYLVLPLLGIISGLLFLLFAVFQDRKGESKAAKIFSAIWFIPGIISVISYFFNAYQAYLSGGIIYITAMGWISLFSGLLVSIPMAFLLGWWLTHPYKKEKPVYQMPVAQPYGQPVYQTISVSDTTHKVFCSGCGRELPPEENFCRVCGKQRTMPAQGAQPTFQQPVYPQMGYVQDAPSGGMTALGFFFPIVGLILYLVWKDQTPLKAHSAGKGALIGVIVWTALSIILAILAYVIPLLVFYSYY